MTEQVMEQDLGTLKRAELVSVAAGLGIEAGKQTKAELLDAIVARRAELEAARSSRRSKSVIEKPVQHVWARANEMEEVATEKGVPLRRKDVVNTCIADGVAFYTARTQYQLWSKASPAEREAKINS